MSIQLQEIKNIFIKNRLTEGVDFKRYEWLVGDGAAYIDTNVPLKNISNYSVIVYITHIGYAEGIFGGRIDAVNDVNLEVITWWTKSDTLLGMDFGNYQNNRKSYTVQLGNQYKIEWINGELNVNNEYIATKQYTTSSEIIAKLFASQNFASATALNAIFQGKIASLIISDVINLIPCQLLKSIPATLDANNIARSAGECGMYDSISGKFYGNVANTGTFTVEGDVTPETHSGLQQIYQNRLIEGEDYETYDWLKGDGIAYINTNYLLDFDDIKTSVLRTYNANNQIIEGSRYEPQSTTNKGAGTVLAYSGGASYGSFFSPNGSMSSWNKRMPINLENIVVMSKNGITLNGTNISSTNVFPIVGSRFESVTPYLIFASWAYNWQIDDIRQKVDYKSFEIEGKLHLVPCQLLHSIPRNLDAQCKERVAGECGMIDLISGKFYGNVASSGTFTVENDNNE